MTSISTSNDKLYQIHHIVPRHVWKKRYLNLKGFNHPSNRLKCTISEHANIHGFLFDEYWREEDLIANQMLSGQITTAAANRKAWKIKRKTNDWWLGKTHSIETKNKMSYNHSKENNPFFGKKHRKESKEKMASKGANHPLARHWIITSPDGTMYECIGTLEIFCKKHNISYRYIRKCFDRNQWPSKGKHVGWKITSKK